ncbi:MAG TPA: DNA repair protein Rad50 [Slackia equolifaciens]|uniref:DNA repair protein Rad50 n=1 Tax=Slackia equolifaciens TaxID=498718 RepID=A0A9D2UYG5_9ACTN|nr:DNA repair protein Rad50 [Slackia equolifaciens]
MNDTKPAAPKQAIAPDSPEADALFAHMEELVDALPAMEAEGERLARARAAREVARLERYRKGQEKELQFIQKKFDEQMAIERAAKESGDDAAEENARYNALNLGNQKSIRYGAEQNAALKVKEALQTGGFSDLDEAHAAELDDDEFAALEQKVEEYRSDYSDTLAACQAIVDAEEAQA